ncbi:hypothetical protein [Halorussus lipolyticus]|uniref:hypothetical protein n=1 Tax=Halorussus lipolyticus TaxID=3034024 RepID=UPI0023E7654E|nr:hypothetical protein [Halorussus sp. DT80]
MYKFVIDSGKSILGGAAAGLVATAITQDRGILAVSALAITCLVLLTISFAVLEMLREQHYEKKSNESKPQEEKKYTQLRLTEISKANEQR